MNISDTNITLKWLADVFLLEILAIGLTLVTAGRGMYVEKLEKPIYIK